MGRAAKTFLVACALAASVSTEARAQDFAVPRFHPAFAGDRFFGVPSPDGVGHRSLHAAMFLDYARNPLVFRRSEDGTTDEEIVGRQLMLHLNATYHVWERIAINADVPFAILQSGNWVDSPQTADLGDIRLGLRSRLLGMPGKLFHFSIGGQLWLPTGTGAYVSDGTVRGLVQAIFGGRAVDRLIWSLAIGPEFRASQLYFDVQQGPSLNAGAGIAWLFGDSKNVQVGLEATMSQVLVNPSLANLNAEALVHGQLRITQKFVAGAGIGTGLSLGPGTPQYRVVAMFAYVPRLESTPPPDWDGDGVGDETDDCPQFAGIRKYGGCPNKPARTTEEPKEKPASESTSTP